MFVFFKLVIFYEWRRVSVLGGRREREMGKEDIIKD